MQSSVQVGLYAANNTPIKTFGEKNCVRDLGLGKPIEYNFILTDVSQAIIGFDLLAHYNLAPDLCRKCLIDLRTLRGSRYSAADLPGYHRGQAYYPVSSRGVTK